MMQYGIKFFHQIQMYVNFMKPLLVEINKKIMANREWLTIREYSDILFEMFDGIAKITIANNGPLLGK